MVSVLSAVYTVYTYIYKRTGKPQNQQNETTTHQPREATGIRERLHNEGNSDDYEDTTSHGANQIKLWRRNVQKLWEDGRNNRTHPPLHDKWKPPI